MRLKNVYEVNLKMFENQKAERRQIFQNMSHRQTDTNQAIKQRNKQIMFKL